MALTIQVSKVSVEQTMQGAYIVTLKLVCLDGAQEVINKTFSQLYKQGASVPALKARLQQAMQAAIDGYKAAQNIYGSAALNNAVTDIQSALVG